MTEMASSRFYTEIRNNRICQQGKSIKILGRTGTGVEESLREIGQIGSRFSNTLQIFRIQLEIFEQANVVVSSEDEVA